MSMAQVSWHRSEILPRAWYGPSGWSASRTYMRWFSFWPSLAA